MAIVMHLGGIFVSGGISEDLFVPPAPSGLLGGERQPSPTAMARHARGDALRSGPVGRWYPWWWLGGLDVRPTRRRWPCKAGKAVACLLLLYLYTYLEAYSGARISRLYFLRPAPTCLPPAGAAAEGVHCMPRGHRPPPGTIRRWACAGPADRHWVACWSGAGRGLWWPCLSKPRIGPTGGCWGATGAINKPHGGSWVALSAGFGGMSVEMAMLVRNLGGVKTKVSTQTINYG